MSNVVSLDSIREAAEAKYGSYDIAGVHKIDSEDTITVKLLNPLRMTKPNRDALMGLQTELGEEGADQEALLAKAIRLAAESEYAADALLAEVGDDLAILAAIFEGYTEGAQVGEASASVD